MNETDLEFLLHRILSGYLLLSYKNEKYELRRISNQTRYEADLIYQKIINDEKYADWIREDNMMEMMMDLGLWHKDTNKILSNLDKKIENLKVDLFKSFLDTAKQKSIRKAIESSRNQLNRLNNTKAEFIVNTLEGYASSIKHEYIICNTLYCNNKKVFNNNDNDLASYSIFNDLVNEINKHIISLSDFKKLARSNIWKSYWNAEKTNVFKGPVTDWTDDQRSLVNMTKMYDSVYEHPECPNEKVIEDDDMLDGWMIVQRRKHEKAKAQNSVDEINPNLKNAQEVFLFGQKKEDIEEILALNSDESMRTMKEKMNYIKNVGQTEDSNLPDVQREIMTQAQSMIKNRK
jgi:hypothetical protein